ncbi:E3 ubiquitin-protein ligase RNF25 [Harmonia axyridis]|uniref:E3 ubiquitin-protein ligase RNF25 n=1 Tax=Harmonia axyridis TaxID=115357 RepID=UPI001E277C1D|nr:E3 ubiquitin-protein ligase RNF25 [Harmonia axyridis]
MSTNAERVKEEIEALEAIFMDDISISYDEKGNAEGIKMTIFPSTANDTGKQYVCLTLEVSLPKLYPDCEPKIELKNPRGLDDSVFDNLYIALKNKCLEYSGQPVIYELIELVRENLTESNLPTCQCAVCLYGFCEGDDFTKTQCFHYFHSFCLAKHLLITEKHYKEEQEKLPPWQRSTKGFQAVCPVCREAINCDVDDLKKAVAPRQLEDAQHFSVSSELRILQAKMQELFSYQKSRGGIIDIEEEENKHLLITNSSEDSSQSDDPGPSFGPVDNTPRTNPIDRKMKKHTNSR